MSGYRLRPKAVHDLQAIGDFIAADNPARAFIDELFEVCAGIAERPKAYRRRDDLAVGLRQAIHGRYLILFTAGDEGVVIERVLHGARRLEDLKICCKRRSSIDRPWDPGLRYASSGLRLASSGLRLADQERHKPQPWMKPSAIWDGPFGAPFRAIAAGASTSCGVYVLY